MFHSTMQPNNMFVDKMEENFVNETSQLHCLLEKHKQLQERSAFKTVYQHQVAQNNMNLFHTENNYYNAQNNMLHQRLPPSTMGKVYVNPNYALRGPAIHINPHVQMKPSIHLNPKLIQNITNTHNQEQIPRSIQDNHQPMRHTNMQNKCSVHVNPKLMNKIISKVSEESQQKHSTPSLLDVQTIPVAATIPASQIKPSSSLPNRTESSNIPVQNNSVTSDTSSMRKSPVTSTPIAERKSSTNDITQSKANPVKTGGALKKSPNSSLVALSRRKLVRIRKSPKSSAGCINSSKALTPMRRRLSSSAIKKGKIVPKNISSCRSQLLKTNSLKFISSIDKYKTDWYNEVDKTILKLSCKKKIVTRKKVSDNSVGLVSIGGIMYKTSRNQLIRSNPNVSPMKRRRSLTSSKNCQYYVTRNGKKLLKLDLTKDKINSSVGKLNVSNTSNTSTKSYKTNASNKVKQRSLQILRNKMRKNNQTCLLFQRFGYCANQDTGTCPKVHDIKQVAVCRNFLQGKCLLDNCRLSHDVGPEKMPTCKYFLEGCCTRDKCPYLHVKVSSKNPICVEFLRGYCPQGNECQNRHIFACPEFDKTNKCSKGKFCLYPHKSHLTETKRFKGNARRKSNATSTKQTKETPTEPKIVQSRKRYYDETSEDLSQKREKLLRHVKIIKDVYDSQSNVSSEEKDTNIEQSEVFNVKDSMNSEEKVETLCSRPRRPPIGPLPAYIPID